MGDPGELPLPSRIGARAGALDRYLGRVARRTLWFKVVRGAAFAAGAALVGLAVAAAAAGPALGTGGATLAWGGLALSVAIAAAVGVGRVDELKGARRALLLRPLHPRLAERARSASELAAAPNGSSELLEAFVAELAAELDGLPPGAAIRRPPYFWRTVGGLLTAALLAGLALALRDDLGSGLYALTHPGREGHRGDAQGLWVARTEVRLSRATPNGDSSRLLIDPRVIEVSEGWSVALTVYPRVRVERALAETGDLRLPLNSADDGALRVSFTAEKSGSLWLKALRDGGWVEDSVQRRLAVTEDRTPVVTLSEPAIDTSAREDEPVRIAYRVEDDRGLSAVDLVVQLGPGRERKVRLVSFDDERPVHDYADGSELVPRSFGASAGQTLAVWIEARDRDNYPQANLGRSEVRLIRVGEPEQPDGASAPLAELERTRDLLLGTLADRLEAPLPAAHTDASARTQKLTRGGRAAISALAALRKAYGEGAVGKPTRDALADMEKRLTRLTRDELSAQDPAELRRLDGAMVAELEDDTLWLTDLLGRERLSSASSSIARAEATQARMERLLEELKRTGDPDKRAALMNEIARARRELSEVAQKLATAARDVPSDFVNYDALQGMTSEDPLSALEKALAAGDMAAAEKALAALGDATKGLARGIDEGGEAFADARFAPRAQRADEARAELRELSEGQKRLSGETGKVAERTAEQARSDATTREAQRRLAQAAGELEQRTRALPAHGRVSSEAEAKAAAAQRLRDARDALAHGDAREAQAMAERAQSDLEQLADDMMMDARMFPGRDNARLDAARRAGQLAAEASELGREIGEHVSPPSRDLSEDDADSLRKQAPRQRSLSELAQDLEKKLRDDGPQGASEGLSKAARSMRNAAASLERGELREAEAHQRDALEKLGELDEQLGRESQADRNERGEPRGEGAEGGERVASDEKVAIPTGDDGERRSELRRRVLDVRRAEPPARFAKAVERYYQEILR